METRQTKSVERAQTDRSRWQAGRQGREGGGVGVKGEGRIKVDMLPLCAPDAPRIGKKWQREREEYSSTSQSNTRIHRDTPGEVCSLFIAAHIQTHKVSHC